MGMTIEESMLYMELYKRKLIDSVSDLEKDIEAYDVAIDTMRKYQKIEKILKEPCILPEGCYPKLKKIKEVVEDGNDD